MKTKPIPVEMIAAILRYLDSKPMSLEARELAILLRRNTEKSDA